MGDIKEQRRGNGIDSAIDYRRIKEKAACELRGVLQGIVADEKIKPREVQFLNTWLRSQKSTENSDAADLKSLVSDVLSDGVISAYEMQEIYILIDDIIQFGRRRAQDTDTSMNELIGLIAGIASDGEITADERSCLAQWLKDNEDVLANWSDPIVSDGVKRIVEQRDIDEDDIADLLAALIARKD